MDEKDIQGWDFDVICNCLHSLESAIECTCYNRNPKKKEVMINILIGKEEEDLLKLMDKKELKELEEIFKSAKPVLDALGKKETTDQDIKDFIKLIEENHCKDCKYKKYAERFTINFSLPEDYYGNDKYNEI